MKGLNHYYIFYVVAHTGSFSKAAEQLFISQPAVSKAIKKLEEQLNTPLFHRLPRKIVLTRQGETLYQYISDAMQLIEQGEQSIQSPSDSIRKTITIGISNTLCKFILLPHLKDFMNLHPEINLKISCQSSNDTLSLLADDKLQLGVICNTELTAGLVYENLRTIHDIFVTSRTCYQENSLQKKSRNNSALSSMNYILLNQENITRHYIDSFLEKEKIVLPNIIEVNNLELALDFARSHLGISCAIKEFILPELHSGELQEVSFSKSIPARKIGFVYKNHTPDKEAILNIMSFIRSTL